MRKRIWITCLVVLVICLLLFLKATQNQSVATKDRSDPATNQSSQVEHQVVTENRQKSNSPLVAANSTAPATSATIPPESNTIAPSLRALLRKPIDFYGKVVDENGNPLASANIQFRWDDLAAEDMTGTATTVSDASGLFSLQDKLGATLTVSVSKGGYYTPRGSKGSFHYAFGNPDFSSDPRNPTIFQLRKRGEGEPLIEKDFPPGMQIWQLHHDGMPIGLDLLSGIQSSAGQLKLELWRDISNRKEKRFDWKLQISVPGGGVISSDEEFPFQAPEGGYQPSIVIDMPKTNQNWAGEVRRKYYIQLPDGKYGRFDFYLLPYNGAFTVHSSINPSGSRNLEPTN